MPYLFGAGATDKIALGTGVTLWTTKVSVFVRVRPAAADASAREFLNWVTPGTFDWQLFFGFDTGGTNRIQFGYRDTVPSYHIATWTSSFAAGSHHTLVGVIDLTLGSANVAIYADTDATAKATANTTVAPIAATAPTVILGNHQDNTTQSLAGVFYEGGLWIQTALSGANAAALGAGNPSGIPLPTYYYPFTSNATALYGGINGTVTGATLAETNLYAPAVSGGGRLVNGGLVG